MSVSNLLLIDSSVTDYHIFVNSVNTSTIPIVYSSATTRAELFASLSAYTSIERIGIAFSNESINIFIENDTYFSEPLSPFSENMNFMISLIQQWNVKNIDYLACDTLNVPGWKEYYAMLSEQTGVVVGASNNNTGNIAYGGDWVLESTGQDIEMIYFTQNIEYYIYLLDSTYSNYSVLIKQDNTIHFAGDNTHQITQIGDSSKRNTLTLSLGMAGLTITQISSGYDHTAILVNNGDVYVCGRANTGGTGFPDTISRGRFTQMPNATTLTPKSIACGDANTYLLMNDASGSIYGLGPNLSGQLGINTSGATNYFTLQLMQNLTGKVPVSISAGNSFLIIIMSDNSIYGVGSNGRGQIGNYVGNALTMQPITLPTGRTPLQISCGFDFWAALMTDASGNKSVYGLGYNNSSQMAGVDIGQYDTFQLMTLPGGVTPVSIACSVGSYNTFVLMDNGTVYGVGINTGGQLGIGSTTSPQTSFQLVTFPTVPSGLKATSIVAGSGGIVILMDNGSVYGCGENNNGQLGLGNYETPALTLQLMPMPAGLTPIYIYAGVTMNFVQMNNGTLYGTGSNTQGQLGVGSAANVYREFIQITPFNYLPVMVECGNGHMIVLTTNGDIYGNGNNTNGQLGLGNLTTPQTMLSLMENTTGLTPIKIACGTSHTIVLMNDASGTIYGTGLNTNGQLGIEQDNITEQTTLQLMQNTTGKIPKEISCGSSYTIVLMNDASGSIYGTGLNTNGQLGIEQDNITQQTTLQLMQNTTGLIPKDIACGNAHTIVLMNDASGTIYVTGLNNFGQLGIATGNVTQQTTLQLMQNTTGLIPKDIACGNAHTIVLMNDASGSIYVTGRNNAGQLGTSNMTNRTTLIKMPNTSGLIPVAISGGSFFTIVLMSNGSIYGTGINGVGQYGYGLGSGTYSGRYTSLQEITTISSVRQLPSSQVYLNSPNIQSICFKHDSKILTDKGYVPIQHLRKGDLIKTLTNGFVPIYMIGKRDMYHVASKLRINDQLYVCTSEAYPEIFEPLVITGCHSILVDEYSSYEEREHTIKVNGNTYITEDQYRLPVCADKRAKIYEKRGIHTIYHISLEHNDYFMNYGIYANGLLVETCSKRFMKELSNMEIL